MTTPKTLIDSVFVATGAATKLYGSPANGKGTYLDVMTALNDNAGAQTLTLYIVPSGGSVAAVNQQVKAKSLAIGATDLLVEMRGKFLDAGDEVWGVASAATSISVFASGREV